MILTVLGCSGSVPGPGVPASGYLVQAGGTLVALDFGNGVLAALSARRDPLSLDALLLSHLHPDHCADMTALAVLRRYDPVRRPAAPLPVHAPREAASRLAAAYAPSAAELAETDLSDVFAFRPLEPGTVRIGECVVTAARVAHPCEAFGFRIEHEGAVLAYTGDTGPCDAVVELARGADVLLSEATWPDLPDLPRDLHLSGREAGELATAAGVRKLVLTHIAPWFDAESVAAEARAAFSGPVELAAPGAEHPVLAATTR
ncbi:Ribonuclease BN, tRNA processing enzyme [Streptoalloteichus tenebrarius]|uniref:Ribonuclease BN, tRNA processing enzyme n=1 Tax=Streptoalloteichus tenebrarius (strain ATCC 17920 / DSM 40477 / JCM 4838 / CBS 697.72 / NBRC 16177 / NCIMB 11028 / NRRL B-12390 / A12253. 1 / ISP 5477) TaxID=1933 RepID=A0ABT1I3L5_STRSD|nr:MBL fold metallo-hydrolase [Streptoalloteichus tenebrarius]MCP2262383.1 Ribonuclease BN, tRNA processing enzyme [Streptoalloteichus tenebrarius]BFF00843.1 MBL fold metallo-hydrolase [Streptoalloteichus tenebrarius]